MQHDLDGVLLRVVLVALAPVVADGVGEDGPALVEGGRRDAAADVGIPLEAMLGVLVPEVKRPVRPGRAEGAVDRVERDVVDGVDVGDAVDGGIAVAFEREVGAARSRLAKCFRSDLSVDFFSVLPGVLVLHILNGAATLDAANREAGRVGEATNHARLPLERALHRLVELGRVLEVDHIDVPVGRPHNAEVVAHVHAVHAILTLYCSGWGALLAEIPIPDRLVPGTRDDHGAAAAVEEAACSHRLVVRADDNVLLRGEVAHLDVLVCARRDDLGAILHSVSVQAIIYPLYGPRIALKPFGASVAIEASKLTLEKSQSNTG